MMKTILRRASPFLIVIVFLALAAILMSTKEAPEQKPDAAPVPIIDVTSVQQRNMSLSLSSYGVVNPKYKTQLVTEVQGRMLSIADTFVAGGIVHKGEQLAQIEPSDYQADLIQAQASLAQAQAALNEEKARGEVAKIEFKGYDKGLPPELGLRIPQLKKEQANVKYAEAALARAQRNLDRTVIRAPFDGIIKARNIDLGQYVTLGTNLGELYGTSIAEIRLPLANDELAYLESVDNPNTQVTLSASLAGENVSWEGRVVRSEGVIDADNRMVYLVAEVQDPYLRSAKAPGQLPLKFGSFVSAEIEGRSLEAIVALPRHIVRNEHVAVVSDKNIIEMRHVNVVHTDLELAYIKGSLADGERVSLTNLNNMADGQLVKVVGEDKTSDQDPLDEPAAPTLMAAGDK
ncbi:efflux RND transporter periplasmic adaptor subunit [Shewanella salipaludis]|uniref:Efflux RND transporter periplasmic adaptor subunit n=1 Tax=Shewanella salipaludis TaxID=2723052 RepID=A0A972JNT6_9GAMM|nr:efflux RND transporter periplasmic adaptor subunit [Shewanella salipaludis]NMH66486.1 efflux RND transporter periplasmic adaptor subunit [Shewanella salipaludis]